MDAPAQPWPWWRTTLLVSVIAAALTALALSLPTGRATLVLLVGVGVFVWLIQRNPAFWLRRLAGACVSAAALTAAVPALSIALDLGTLGSLRLQTEGAGWFALAFLVTAVALAALEVRRERPAPPELAPSGTARHSQAGLNVDGARDVELHAGGDNVGGNKTTTVGGDQVARDKVSGDQVARDKFGGDQVARDKFGGDQVARRSCRAAPPSTRPP